MAVVGLQTERRCIHDNGVAAGIRTTDPNVDAGECGADLGDQPFGFGPGPVMDRQRYGAGVRQRIGEGGAGPAGPGHIKSLAFDVMTLLDQSADKAAAVQQRTAEAAVRLAADRVDHPGVHAIALEPVAKPGRLRLVRRGDDEAVEVGDRFQAGPASRQVVAPDLEREGIPRRFFGPENNR